MAIKICQKCKDAFMWIKASKKRIIVISLLLLLALGAAIFLLYQTFFKEKVANLKREYTQVYSLTSDKISQGANIVLNLPKDFNEGKEAAKNNVKFDPVIKGVWLENDELDKIIFKPQEKLKMGRYYSVALKVGAQTIGSDFLIVDDPKILTVFPKKDSETSENSEITIMFNRPMVPVTTLDVLASFDIPIEITPNTKGKFKWIGSQTLQFIPEERLTRSSNYNVKVKPNFVSLDGLKVEGFEQQFKTRVLRNESISNGTTIYNNPIAINFNQPVDLEKTAKEISLMNTTSNTRADFIFEYGSKSVYNEKTKKNDKVVDESVILIYNKKDQFGREKLWDFKDSYNLKINKAYPEEGDIIIDSLIETNIEITDIISSISATSERTSFATPDFFDPQGKLWVEFYEDINLLAISIKADNLIKFDYGEKCKEASEDFYAAEDVDCEKEIDKKKIYLTFDDKKIGNSQTLKINFEKIVNISGLKINNSVIAKEIKAIPDLIIISTLPNENESGASLSEFVVCSNSPIKNFSKEDVGGRIKFNLEYELTSWGSPIKVPIDNNSRYYKCRPGEFESKIYYKLLPESSYDLDLKISDQFSRETSISRKFKTGVMPESYLNFYHYQKRFNVTSPDKTKLTYAVENMDFVDLQICKVDAEQMLSYMSINTLKSDSLTPNSICREVINKKIDLGKKYWMKNFFKIDLKDYIKDTFGHYVLTFSNPSYKFGWGSGGAIYERTFLTVTNLGVVEKKVEIGGSENYGVIDLNDKQKKDLKNVYWISDLKSLEPIKDAKVQLYSSLDNLKLVKENSFSTNGLGVAETSAVNNLHGAIISKGLDSAVISGSGYDSNDKFQYGSVASQSQKIYIYTDRPIYKPGQEVNIKGIYRIGYDGAYEILKGEKVTLQIFNSRGESVQKEELEINDFGTFNTKIIIDTKAPLGNYRIDVKGSSAYFEVEEYAPAPFKVDTATDKEEYVSGDTLNMNIDASYYFGAPLQGGEVEYNIASQDYYFDKYQDEYFDFGNPWYYCYGGCDYGSKFILRNKTNLDNSGKAKISYAMDLKKLFKNQENVRSKIFIVYVTVKNSNGQSVSSVKSFIVHNGEFYLGLKTDKYFMGKNEKFNIMAKSVDINGKNTKVDDITLKISKVDWVQNKRKEVDGGYYNNWEKKLTTTQEKKISTDQNGNWKGEFSIKEEGSYEISLEAKDKKGNAIKTSYEVYVYGQAHVDVRRNNDETLEMLTEKNSLKIGDKGSIVIKAPYDKAKALISIERGKIFRYEIVDVNQNLFNYTFDVTPELLPNFYVTAILISPDPEVKFGKLDFQVDTEKKKINISAKSNKTSYLPGEEVTLDFESKDDLGKPAETEFSVAIADLSVLALKGNPKKNPLVFFYGGFPLAISTSSNIKNILFEVNVPGETKGGGGGGPEDLATKKRGEFKDTAFWQANVITDSNGKAQVKFKLPDNLTTWQVESVGVTKDTKLGVAYGEFMTQKNVMVVPLKPRFVVPGDEFMIGAKIFNQTNSKQNLDVTFESGTLNLNKDKNKKTVSLNPKESKTIYFNVVASPTKKDGIHTFTLSAKNKEFEDTVENSIDITRNNTYEATATSGYSKKEAVDEFVYLPDNIEKDRGEMTVKSSATLAVFLSDALNYLLGYPYGCSEQVASKLDAIAIVKKEMNIKNMGDKFQLKDIEFDGKKYTVDEAVSIGLARLYANQKSDGSFGYYPESSSNIYLTLHVAETIKNLKDAGYSTNEDSLRRSFGYINNRISYDGELQKDRDFMILGISTLSKLNEYGKLNNNLIQYIKSFKNDKAFLNEKISNTSLTSLALLHTQNETIFGKDYKDNVFDALENRIDIDSRGAFLPLGKNIIFQYYETPIKDTSLLLKAMVADKRDNEILDKILRWMLRSRSKDGAWGSTNNTLSVMDSLIDYLNWQKETESAFTLTVFLDNEKKQSFDYNAQTILTQNSLEVPIKDMKFGKISNIKFQKENKSQLNNNFYYDIGLKYFLPINQIPPRDEGFTITREFFALDDKDNKNPLQTAKVGDVIRGRIKVLAPSHRSFVSVEDFIPAGTELVNFNLATEDQSLLVENEKEDYEWWNWYYNDKNLRPDTVEYRDDRLFLFKEGLEQGEYEYDYYLRVLIPGKFLHLPAVVSEMYFPENFARTSGGYFEVK